MRAFLIAIAAIFVAGCATAPAGPAGGKIAVYDHKNNVTRYVDRPADNSFVGTSARAETRRTQPTWYLFGHP